MAGSAMLFACTKCHSRHKFEDLSKEEQLCKECRRKHPLVSCNYCQLEFHILKKIDGTPVCGKCAHNVKTYGKPKSCRYCLVKAAFKDKCCARCISSEKKYGPAIKCQGCSLVCAFNKKESQAKVQGKILCLRCTLKFKKDRHNTQKQHHKDKKYPSKSSASKTVNPVLAPLKAENITKSLYKSRVDTVEQPSSRHTSGRTENNNSIEHTFGDHMTELTSLREQMIQLKRTITQKDKIIFEKDKKINEFQADQWEKEKLQRNRTQNIHKEYEERIENLQLENASLRKQVKDLTKAKKTPKLDKISSRIRLEAHKINLTPTSGRSPEHTLSKKEATVEDSNTEAENTADESAVEDNPPKEIKKDVEEPDTSQASDSESESENKSKSQDLNEQKHLPSFDEAQADEIKKLFSAEEDGNQESATDNEEKITTDDVPRKKTIKRKRKIKLSVEEKDDEDDEEEDERQRETDKKKRKKTRKSKAIISDQEDTSDDEINVGDDKAAVSAAKDDGDDGSGNEENSPKMEIDERGGDVSPVDDKSSSSEEEIETSKKKKTPLNDSESDKSSADSSDEE